jgi:translocation and assembly module TamA
MRLRASAFRAAPIASVSSVFLLGLGGCSALQRLPTPAPLDPLQSVSTSAGPSVGGSSASATAAAAAGSPASYRLVINAPEPLARLLRTHLDLARFQQATAADAITPGELDRLVVASEAQARDLLRTEGYFTAQVTSRREIPLSGDPSPPLVQVQVDAGPRTRVSDWVLRGQGELEADREASDPRATGIWRDAVAAWPLAAGAPFTQAAWDDAKSAVLARLRASGYPQASVSGSSARVDAASQKARLFVLVDSGPLVRLGLVEVQGLQRYPVSSVLNVVDYTPGDPYTEKRLLDLQERLAKVGLFDGVSVELDSDPGKSERATVQISVREAPLQQATLGAGVSANTGPRVSLEHTHRRPLGLDWIVRNKLQVGRDERSWQGTVISHPLRRQYRALGSGKVEWLDAGDAVTLSRQVRAGGSLDTERIERLFFLEALNDELRNVGGRQSATAVSANYHLVWRDVDSVVLPVDGETANMQAGLGQALSNRVEAGSLPGLDTEINQTGPYARAYGRFTLYRPFANNWYFTGRLEVGQIFAANSVLLPDTLRFRAGGDESVRGYAFRSLGPTTNGLVASGRVLGTLSVEAARPVSAALPSVWGAAFVDAGNAADQWGDWRPVVGYGVGVRWRSPVGPLRVDLAYGEAVRRARLHVSVGIAF